MIIVLKKVSLKYKVIYKKNCFQDDGRVGDVFMRQVEPIAAYVPYMTSPGNHEHPE